MNKGSWLIVAFNALIGKASFSDVSVVVLSVALADCLIMRPKDEIMDNIFFIPDSMSIIGVFAVMVLAGIIGGFLVPLILKNRSENGKDADWEKHYIVDALAAAVLAPLISVIVMGLVVSYWFPSISAMEYIVILALLIFVMCRWVLTAINNGVDALIDQLTSDAANAKKLGRKVKDIEETVRIEGKQ